MTMQGAINMDIGFNFQRTNDKPLNPRLINFGTLWVKYRKELSLTVNLDNEYKLLSQRTLNQDITFVYGKVKATKILYDDIIGDNIFTPILVLNYCDLAPNECQDRGLQLLDAQTDESSWWKSLNHNTPTDGNIVLDIGYINGIGDASINNNTIAI